MSRTVALPFPSPPFPWLRIIGWSVLWGQVVTLTMLSVGLPWWSTLFATMLIGFVVPVLVRRRVVYNAWFRWKHREERRRPIVLDEDGKLHHPPLVPLEESLAVLYEGHPTDPDRRPLAAAIVRRDGTVLAQADWSARR